MVFREFVSHKISINLLLSKMIVFEKKLLTVMVTIVNEGSSLTIVNEELLLKIVNETTNFIKRIVFGKTINFEKKLICNIFECCLT